MSPHFIHRNTAPRPVPWELKTYRDANGFKHIIGYADAPSAPRGGLWEFIKTGAKAIYELRSLPSS